MQYIFLFLLLNAFCLYGQPDYFIKSDSTSTTPDSVCVDTTLTRETSFTGGDTEFSRFIRKNLKYPQIDQENKIQGAVYVQFIVNTDGTITDIDVVKGLSPTIDAEVIRIIKLMPDWIPETSNGNLVRVRKTIPVKFELHY